MDYARFVSMPGPYISIIHMIQKENAHMPRADYCVSTVIAFLGKQRIHPKFYRMR